MYNKQAPTLLPCPDPTHDTPFSYLSKTQKERHPVRASSTLTFGTKGFEKLRSWNEHFPQVGLCVPRSRLTCLPEQRRESKQSPGTRQALSLPLSSLLPCLAPTHPHLLVTYLRRSKAQAVCQGGNDISSGTAEKTPDSCCGILRRMCSPGP